MHCEFEFTRNVNGEPKREVVMICYPDDLELEWALHRLGLECCLKNQKGGEFQGDLCFPELMESVTPKMLAPYGMTVLWPNRTSIPVDDTVPIISRYELETYREISNNGYTQVKKICRVAERLARRLESQRTHGHQAISTWAPNIISTKAVTWADQFVNGNEPDLSKFFEKKLQDAKPHVSGKDQTFAEMDADMASGEQSPH